MSEQPPVGPGDEPTQPTGALPGSQPAPPPTEEYHPQGSWPPGPFYGPGPGAYSGPGPYGGGPFYGAPYYGAPYYGAPYYGAPYVGAPYPAPPPRPRRQPHPLLALAVGVVAAAMIALGVGIGYIVWGSTATSAVRSRSSLPTVPVPTRPFTGSSTTSTGSSSRGFLGVEIAPTSAGSSASGAKVVAVVPDSPAAKAGLAAGDVITSFGTRTVSSALTLEFDTEHDAPGTKVKVGWTATTGKHDSATVTLAKRPSGGTSVG